MIEELPVQFDSVILETAGSMVSRLSEDVLLLKFKTDQLIVKKEAILIDENLCMLAGKKPHYVIIDALGINSNMDSNALKFFSKESAISKQVKGAAILFDNLPIRLTASIFIKFHNPVFKTVMLKNTMEAQRWFDKLRSL